MRPIYHDTYQDSSNGGAASGSSSSSSPSAAASNPQPHGATLPHWTPSGGSWQQQAPAEYAQQQAMASILPAQLGSVDGLHRPTGQQQQGSGLAAAAAAAGLGAAHLAQLQSQHAVRVSPRQPQQEQQQEQQSQQHGSSSSSSRSDKDDKDDDDQDPPNWVDDDRYSWADDRFD
jgi:hypothetical protein